MLEHCDPTYSGKAINEHARGAIDIVRSPRKDFVDHNSGSRQTGKYGH